MVRGRAWTFVLFVSASSRLQPSDYFSEEYFPGLHLLDVQASKILVYKDCRRPTADAPPVVVSTGWKTMDEARIAFEAALSIPKSEPLQTPWAFFDAQGTRLDRLEDMMQQKVAFLIEIGQWMWPAVRVGFEQQANGVLNGASIMLRTLSLRPVVFEIQGFILPEEADKIIELGLSRNMFNSIGTLTSVDAAAKRRHDDYRTSTQTWLANNDALVVQTLDYRTSNLTRVPASHNEPVQLLRYGPGQFYHAHLDWTDLRHYDGQPDQWRASHFGWEGRMATLFWYLSEVDNGGHTIFPKHNHSICRDYRSICKGSTQVSFSNCEEGLKIFPKKGSVILWYNYHPNGRGDQNALHGGCAPAIGFEKWSGNKWIHIKPLDGLVPDWMPDHPALERFGWHFDTMQLLAGTHSRLTCHLTIKSEHPSTLTLRWVSPEDDTALHDVSTLDAHGEASINSFEGHEFRLSTDTSTSSPFLCSGTQITYRVTGDLRVLVDEAFGEL